MLWPHDLEVVLLALLALRLALADNALAEPLLLEAIIELLKVLDHVATAANNSFLGGNGTVRLNAKLEHGEQRMWNLVGGEDNLIVLEEALREEVAERVVLLVECEDGRIGDACRENGVSRSATRQRRRLGATYEFLPWSQPWTGPRPVGTAQIYSHRCV